MTGTVGESESSFNTSLGKIRNATAVFVSTLNGVRKMLGLTLLSYGEGSIASANMLPALDTVGTGAAVGSTVDFYTAYASAAMVKTNIHKLELALNEVLVALGQPAQASALSVGISEPFLALSNVPVTVTDTSSGATSMLVTAVTTFLADVANDFATMAAAFNDYVIAPYNDPLTNSTGRRAPLLRSRPTPSRRLRPALPRPRLRRPASTPSSPRSPMPSLRWRRW